MADELLVFEQTVEALFVRALGPRLTPRLRERLLQAGLAVDGPLLAAYPFEAWMAFLRIAAEELYPELPVDAGTRQLGVLYMQGYRETLMGRAILSLLRVLGPRRALQRATHNFRSGNNYTRTRLTELGPGHHALWMNEVGPYPGFTAGIIHAGLEVAGARDVRVEPEGHDGRACTYAIRWAEPQG